MIIFFCITTNSGYCLFLSIDPRNRCFELSRSKHKTLITLQTYPGEKQTNKRTKPKPKTKQKNKQTNKQTNKQKNRLVHAAHTKLQ